MQFRRLPVLIVIIVVAALPSSPVARRGTPRRRPHVQAAGANPVDHAGSAGSHRQTRGDQRPDAGDDDAVSLQDESEFDALEAGRRDRRTLVIVTNDAFLTGVKKTGEAPLESRRRDARAGTALDPSLELLQAGRARFPTARSSIRTASKTTLRRFADRRSSSPSSTRGVRCRPSAR